MLKEKERENRADRILSYTVRTFWDIWYAGELEGCAVVVREEEK